MVILAHSGGSSNFSLDCECLTGESFETLMYNVTQLLIARGFLEATGILVAVDFGLFEATNDFNDEFAVLYARVSLPQYEFFRENIKERDFKDSFKAIREAICEIGPYVSTLRCPS